MRAFLTLALLLAAAPLAPAADAALRARVALALALASPPAPITPLGCRCASGSPCRCIECDCPGGRPEDGRHRLTFAAAYDLAVAGNRPVIVWLNMACPPCEAELRDCVHVHSAAHNGDRGPAVIVCLPEGGKLYRRVRLVGTPSAEAIRPWVLPPRPVPTPWYSVPPVSPVPFPASQPAYYAPAMSFFGGGFGGACGPRG